MLQKVKEKLSEIKNDVYNLSNEIVEANNMISREIATSNLDEKEICLNILLTIEDKVNSLNNNIVNVLALYRPEAIDLREMVSYMKVSNDLLRASSNSKNFLLGYEKLLNSDLDISYASEFISTLHKSALIAISTASSMILEQDNEVLKNSYKLVSEEEDKADNIYAELEKTVFDRMKSCDMHQDHFKLITVVKKLEKIADRAASIASLIVYAEHAE